MRASGRWWSAGIVVLVVVAVLLLSMALPVGVAARPVSGGAGASVAVTSTAPASPAPKASSAPAAANPASGSPHPGTLEIYEVAPGGQSTTDPSVAYDTVSYEPIINVYQTLVAYNGSSTASFVPELSTCVPGLANGASSTPSVSCQAVYGNSLVTLNGAGQPIAFTYPIDKAARFYDGATHASWSVYPSDVMFTLSRTMGFAMQPSMYVLNGWIVSQGLLPIGNSKWDNGYHFPLNNTPQHILGSMLVNNSAYCPANVMAASNGCITFLATGEGSFWPFFNDFVADALGTGVEPCGWFTAQAASVPGFAGTTAPNGDGPCLLPGGATSTNDSSFQNYLNTTSPTAWDSFELLALNHPAVQTGVQFNLVGSGPYYIAPGQDQQTVGYTLQASPAYQQPTGCVGVGGGCEPAPGGYQGKVVVLYEPDDTQGIQEYIAGQADAAAIQPPETAQMLQLAANGQIGYVNFHTLSVFFDTYNLAFNVSGEKTIDPTGQLNVPSDFFASNTVRNLLNHAWLYTTVLNSLWTIDGVQYGSNYGGAIPNGMGNYYPTNISWPYLGGDPAGNTSVNSAAWWYQQGINASSPYYDSELKSCTPAAPCKFPLIGELGAPTFDSAFQDWANSINTITGGALQPYTFDLTFPQLVYYSGQAAYSNPMPVYTLGWAPDYPDPTDYMGAMYYANATYTEANAVWQGLETTAAFNVTCGSFVGPTFANLSYWAEYLSTQGQPIPAGCQGPAYNAMLWGMGQAASLPVSNYRTLVYNLVEHIENQLGLYVWEQQANEVVTYAPWINNATINQNVMIGGGGDQNWWAWGYTNAVTTVTFQETGLAAGTSWSVTYAGHLFSSSSSSITVPNQPNGTFPYEVGYVAGYTISSGQTNGTVTVLVPNAVTVSVTFTSFSGGSTLGFQEIGLASGTNWTIVVQGVGAVTGSQTLVTYTLPTGSYNYGVGIQTGYQAPPAGTAATGTVVPLVFTGVLFSTFPVSIQSYGLSGASWTATLSTVPGPGVSASGFTNSSTASSIVFWEPNGTYALSVSSTTSLQPIAFTTSPVVAGAPQTVTVAWVSSGVPATYTVTFSATGATGAWTVSFNGQSQTVTGSSVSFSAPNGTYTYAVVVSPSGQVASPAGGLVTVTGAAASVAIAFGATPTTTSYSNSTSVPTWAYAVIGVFVLLTLVFLVTTLMGRRRPPSPPSPQTWTPGGETKGNEGTSPPPST